MRANRTIKDDNINLDAFKSPNYKNLIEMGAKNDVNWHLIQEPPSENFNFFDVNST
jgi:hypothetical protein